MDRHVGSSTRSGGTTAWRRRLAVATTALAMAALGAACTGASAAPASPSPKPLFPDEGPTSFATWTARQGFGGGAGTAEVQKGAHWLQENSFASDRQSWLEWWASTASDLTIWLDAHPATSCWADMRQAALADLNHIADAFATMRTSVAAGGPIPTAAAADLVVAADHLNSLEPQAGCA